MDQSGRANRSRPAHGTLQLIALIAAIAFGVIGMHQLSAGHVVIAPLGTDSVASGGSPRVDPRPDAVGHAGHATALAGGSTHADVSAAQATHPVAGGGHGDPGCLGCPGHSALTTCMLALILVLTAYVVMRMPGRHTLLTELARHITPARPGFTVRRYLTPLELSISRT